MRYQYCDDGVLAAMKHWPTSLSMKLQFTESAAMCIKFTRTHAKYRVNIFGSVPSHSAFNHRGDLYDPVEWQEDAAPTCMSVDWVPPV